MAVLWLVCVPGPAVAQDNDFLPTPDSQAELNALEAIEAAIGTPDSLTLSDRFLAAYPESELTHLVRRVRVQTYVQMGDHQSTIAEAESALAAESAFHDSRLAEIEDAIEDPGFPPVRARVHERENRPVSGDDERVWGDGRSCPDGGIRGVGP